MPSTETALITVFNDVLLHLDNRQTVYLNLLDLSAAFNTLEHTLLLNRLKNRLEYADMFKIGFGLI